MYEFVSLAKNRDGIKEAFDQVHLERYGTNAPTEPAEIVSLRSSIIGKLPVPKLSTYPKSEYSGTLGVSSRSRDIYFGKEKEFQITRSYEREGLAPGHIIEGPAVIEEHASTTVLFPEDKMEVDEYMNLVITVGRQ